MRFRFALACLALLFAVPCFACTCGFPKPQTATVKTERDLVAWLVDSENADKAILEGIVEQQDLVHGNPEVPAGTMSATFEGEHRIVTVRVLRIYRGPKQERFTILTGYGIGDCGFDFETGHKYLVFAIKKGDGSLFTSICTPTEELELAAPALLRYLRAEPAAAEDSLAPATYNEKYAPRWYGSICGKVSGPDGKPVGKAGVEVFQVRNDSFPPYTADASDLSHEDGTYCIDDVRPGTYLLSAEKPDFDAGNRMMGYYPGVVRHSEAAPIELHAGDSLSNMNFTVQIQPLYIVSFHIVTPDGSLPLFERLGVSIDSPDRDALAYHLAQNRDENGYYFAGYVPPGHYLVQTYVLPGISPIKWQMVKQEVEIRGNSKIELKLNRPK